MNHSLDNMLRTRLNEIYHIDEVIADIVKLGDIVTEPLGRYLFATPESVPHSRVAAVQILGIIGTPAALDQLKMALFIHELKELDPVLAQSEYVVKNGIVEELLQKSIHEPLCDFSAIFERYHLPSAIEGIVKFRLLKSAPLLVSSLENDILSERACQALQQLGRDAIAALLQALEIDEISDKTLQTRSVRQRRILEAIILGEIKDKSVKSTIMTMTEDPNPNVAAVAVSALMKIDISCISLNEAKKLLKGALSNIFIVRENCRAAARKLGQLGLAAALDLIHIEELPDLYGDPIRISEYDKHWLKTYIMEIQNKAK